MEFIIGAVLMLPLYLAAGITVARWQYNTDTTPSSEYREQLATLERKRESMNHGRYCDSRYNMRCDCSAGAGLKRLNAEIAALKPTAEPQMGTIVTWPTYLLKRAARKVYTPRPQAVSSDEFEVDEVSGAAMPKLEKLERTVQFNKAYENDPIRQKLQAEWDMIYAQAEADLTPKDKAMIAEAQKNAAAFSGSKSNPLDAPRISAKNIKR